MYFTVSKKDFYNGLSVVARATSNYSPLPAFSGIKIEANTDELILTGSDSDISIQTVIRNQDDCKLSIKDNGAIVIEARYILEIVRKTESDEIEFEIIDNALTKISGNGAEFKINGMKATDYPAIDFSKPKEVFSFEGHLLKQIIAQTAFATSDKETRPVLTGVNFHAAAGKLNCVGTDSYRLAKKELKIDSALSFNITIPAKSLAEVSKIVEDEDLVEIAVNDKKAQFMINSTIIQTRLIDGAYPETERLIPTSYEYELSMNAHDLLGAIDRASFIKNDGVSVIKLSLDEKECILSTKALEVGSSTEVLARAIFKGEHLEISCNGRYVFDAIRALEGESVIFKFCGEMKPFIIKAAGDDDVLQLVLPVRTYA